MTARTRVLYGFSTLIACCSLGCNWSSLWGLDAPRPSIDPADYFAVDPPCPDLIIDPSAIALVPRTVTITGRRAKTDLGAEGVPVTVRRGPCGAAENNDGARSNDGAVAGDDAATAGRDAGLEPPATDAPSCTEGKRTLSEAFNDGVELDDVEGRGCRKRSPSLLECTLNPRGEATFEVIGHFGSDVVSFDGYVRVCITPLENVEDGEIRTQQKTVYVVPRYGSARYALSVARTDPDPQSSASSQLVGNVPAPVADCGTLVRCEAKRVRGGFVAGLAPTDIPAADVRASDLLANMSPKSVWLKVVVSPSIEDSTANPGLSASASCAETEPDAFKPSLTLELPPQRGTTDPFYVCASGYASPSVSIVAVAGSKEGDASADPSEASPLSGVRSNPRPAPLSPLQSGYEARRLGEPDIFVNARFCGGEPKPADPRMVRVIGAQQAPRSDRLAIACSYNNDDDEAGTAGSGGSAARPNSAPICPATVTLEAMGNTCQLTISE